MSARYLVQVRQHGEPWKTVRTCKAAPGAIALADMRAGDRHIYDDGTTGPVNAYVRVTFKGALLYDPRHPDNARLRAGDTTRTEAAV